MCRKNEKWPLALTAAIAVIVYLWLSASPATAQLASAGPTYPFGIFRDGSLDAHMTSPADLSFSEPGGTRELTFDVTNRRSSDMDILLALRQEDKWSVMAGLGALAPGETKTFSYTAAFNYTGKSNETDTFALIGKTPSGFTGHIFLVHEDWSAYEWSLKSTLSIIGLPMAVLLLIILAIVMAGTLATALNTRHAVSDEYTLRTLFFPLMRARPLAEKIADIIITPYFWVAELLLGSVLILLILAIALRGIRPDIGILIFFIGGVAAIFMPVIFLVIVWLSDYYKREPFRFVFAMFMWGVMSTLVAFFVNTATLQGVELFTGSSGIALAISAVFVAPVVEETAKGLGLLTLSGHHEYDSTFDGIIYGFAVGMGFAAVENWLYFVARFGPVDAGGLLPWVYLILYRSLLGSLSHGCFTAALGGVIGFFKSRASLRRHTLAAFLIGLPVAMFLHGTGNLLVILGSIMETGLGLPVPVFDPLYTILLTTIYIILGAILQLRLKGRQMKGGPKPEG
ncbi:MAG TPA: PrsW family intramembrane metalloprotease [Methanocella sp.]|jgi:RsiW-degrading membrane proteinase PrsW (M82 family)